LGSTSGFWSPGYGLDGATEIGPGTCGNQHCQRLRGQSQRDLSDATPLQVDGETRQKKIEEICWLLVNRFDRKVNHHQL